MKASQSSNFGALPAGTKNTTQTNFAMRSSAANDFEMPNQQTQVDKEGPTSVAAIYNKRNMHATVNDNFARVGNTPS